MVVASSSTNSKNESKYVVSKRKSNVKQDEITQLKARNKVLTNALKDIQCCASGHLKHHFELVWFALNRTRYPNHPLSKNIEESECHREKLEKLRSNDGDFHHGFNSGVLATSRLFKHISDIFENIVPNTHDGGVANDHEEETIVQKHHEEVEKVKTNFPDFSVDTLVPTQN
mmetsp:Transcript_25625/g.31559  ORF Transcript_25625/g.31559 Transcript_25625/m.31559 type:complete len:172 (-) Transcript_25625:229-744(-)